MSRNHLSSALTRRAALVSLMVAGIGAIASAPAAAVAAVQKHLDDKGKEQDCLIIDDLTNDPVRSSISPEEERILRGSAYNEIMPPVWYAPYRRPRFVIPRYWLHRSDHNFRNSSTPSRSRGISGAARRRHVRTRQGK